MTHRYPLVALLVLCFATALERVPFAAQGADLHSGAFTGDGKRLTGLGRLPDSATIVINGQSMSAQSVRAHLRTVALSRLGPPKAYIGSPPSNRRTLAVTVPPPVDASSRTFAKPDPNYCLQHPPAVTHAKGSVTPGGYVVVEGVCLGSSGIIRLAGAFPGNWLVLTPQNWDANSITATIPAVSGVLDQAVELQVIAGRQTANEVSLDFTATREIVPLPAHFITNVACSSGNVDGTNWTSSCQDAAASHWQEDTGTDAWQAQLPAGWALTSLVLQTGSGSILGTQGFTNQPPSASGWTVSWQSGVVGTTSQDTITWGIFISTTTVDITAAAYAMTLYATGPAGTMPQ